MFNYHLKISSIVSQVLQSAAPLLCKTFQPVENMSVLASRLVLYYRKSVSLVRSFKKKMTESYGDFVSVKDHPNPRNFTKFQHSQTKLIGYLEGRCGLEVSTKSSSSHRCHFEIGRVFLWKIVSWIFYTAYWVKYKRFESYRAPVRFQV